MRRQITGELLKTKGQGTYFILFFISYLFYTY